MQSLTATSSPYTLPDSVISFVIICRNHVIYHCQTNWRTILYCARRSSHTPYPTENEFNIAAFLAVPCIAFEHGLHVYLQIARLPKHNGARGRTAVITQGALPTVVASEGKVCIHLSYTVPDAVLVFEIAVAWGESSCLLPYSLCVKSALICSAACLHVHHPLQQVKGSPCKDARPSGSVRLNKPRNTTTSLIVTGASGQADSSCFQSFVHLGHNRPSLYSSVMLMSSCY